MGNIVNTVKRFSSNDATAIPVQRCSNLSIGTSSLDECTCIGNGISVTGETALASKGGSINGCKDFCEVTRVFNSGRGKKSEPTDKTDISGISGFFIFIFYFFIFYLFFNLLFSIKNIH